MKFMKEQEHEILKLETGELVFRPYPNSIGEVMLYDGSLRIAINDTVWNTEMEKIIVDLLRDRLQNTQTQNGCTENEA